MRQPWLPGSDTQGADDFSAATATRRAIPVSLALGLALLLLAMGRAPQILDAAYGLDPGPVTDRALALAEGWDGAMRRWGVTGLLDRLRGIWPG